MRSSSPIRLTIVLVSLFVGAKCLLPPISRVHATQESDALAWPTPKPENRPWTRWWWLGSAVDKANLTLQLEQFKEAGIGGVEICPIYGAKGFEDRYIDYLSPKWISMLAHVTSEAKRFGMDTDMTTGTGWPFGGPEVKTDDAIAKVVLKTFDVAGGASLKEAMPKGRLQCLMAISTDGKQIDLTDKVKDGKLDWTAPAGQWRLYAVVMAPGGMIVKRPAPGGEGLVLDPYSLKALDKYLGRFDKALATHKAPMPRSHFHDSFEYANATWTPGFFKEFDKRRGYDLRTQLPALFGTGPADTVNRVRCDYRATISDMHVDFIKHWTAWCHGHGSLSRDQAHGSPGNLIDIYAAADIPETESYKKIDDRLLPMQKFASSAAHLNGKQLASCESFTWLREHFQTSLADLKPAADFYFLAGINHIFFHGIPYSPQDAPWPGWQFYASVNFGPSGGLWHDLPEFNAYVTRCQSILQAGKPANDILLYWPVHDLWQSQAGGMGAPKGGGPAIGAMQFTVPGTWMYNTSFHNTAMMLWERGFGYDQVSDAFLANAKVNNGAIQVGGNEYRAMVVPACHVMPEATLRKLLDLAAAGATIVVRDEMPSEVPGFGDVEKRRSELKKTADDFALQNGPVGGFRQAKVGKGMAIVGPNLVAMLEMAGLQRESVVDAGVQMLRRKHAEGHHYFLVNRGSRPVDGWVRLATPGKSAVILDPRFEDRAGVAETREVKEGLEIRLQLPAGESCIIRTFTNRVAMGRRWQYVEPAGKPEAISTAWNVRFIEGGPALPAAFTTQNLASWTKQGDAEAKRFAGTAVYTTEFDRPAGETKMWQLDLGQVADSVRVKLNGQTLGTLWCPPFKLNIAQDLRPGKNTLELEVTNVAANRIADMDRRGVKWKIFRDANVAGVNGGNFDASKWASRDAGLLGPVQLTPLKEQK